MSCTRSIRRSAFSLAELVVAIGVLLLMFSLAGTVFNHTIQSTGQARALIDVSQTLRAFEQTLRADLERVVPGSVMLIQANPVNAYWTRQGREADNDGNPDPALGGYPHLSDPAREDADGNMVKPRADILMFFTSLKGTSYVYPDVTSNLQQVVYGHAELGEYVWNSKGGKYDFQPGPTAFPEEKGYPSSTAVSRLPAEEWHLARRGVLLLPTNPDPERPPPNLGDPTILQSERDVIPVSKANVVEVGFELHHHAQTPWSGPPWYLPRAFYYHDGADPLDDPFSRSLLDATLPPTLAERLGHYFLPDCASFKVEWTLNPHSDFVGGRLEGTREVFWFDPGRFDPDDLKKHPLAELEAARDAAAGQLRINLENLLDDRTLHWDGGRYSLSDRFLGQRLQERRTGDPDRGWPELALSFAPELGSAVRPNLVVFRPDPAKGGGGGAFDVVEDIYPSALRITIDVFDKERRLERPTRHVIVAPVGG
ncbi:MAG: type II secretion system protein [Phycisphaerales bacterium]|nr:MAG: type II secretion system protein [Phycisphaerales bacterium]